MDFGVAPPSVSAPDEPVGSSTPKAKRTRSSMPSAAPLPASTRSSIPSAAPLMAKLVGEPAPSSSEVPRCRARSCTIISSLGGTSSRSASAAVPQASRPQHWCLHSATNRLAKTSEPSAKKAPKARQTARKGSTCMRPRLKQRSATSSRATPRPRRCSWSSGDRSLSSPTVAAASFRQPFAVSGKNGKSPAKRPSGSAAAA
mmetsp:Transcript_118560/g.377931  ORF Transcript_118560/g.377931 Transcript_118560/m.377931 type:complete len:201 (+) Transcript_118560:875-1477(+)